MGSQNKPHAVGALHMIARWIALGALIHLTSTLLPKAKSLAPR